MNASKTAKEQWIVIGIPLVIITAVLIVGGILSHEPSAEECLKKAKQLRDEDREESIRKSIRRGEYNSSSPKPFQAALRRSEKWFRKAIDKGHPDAHEALGMQLLVADRTEEALQVLLDGANKGFHSAMKAYANVAYDNGKITDEEAYEWLRIAALRGNVHAREFLEHSREGGRRLPLDVARQKARNTIPVYLQDSIEILRRLESQQRTQ